MDYLVCSLCEFEVEDDGECLTCQCGSIRKNDNDNYLDTWGEPNWEYSPYDTLEEKYL